MICTCGTKTMCKDSRYIPEGMWRRRVCPNCGETFTSLEQFCETHRGKGGSHKSEKAVVIVPKKKDVKGPHGSRRIPSPKMKPKEQPPLYIPRLKSARSRIEDLKMEKEHASVFDNE